jgi:hypothetical protein
LTEDWNPRKLNIRCSISQKREPHDNANFGEKAKKRS